MTTTDPQSPVRARPVVEAESVVIRFCGDSGDGMQLTGSEFTKASALAGNDLSTLPDYPAEIRAPAGSLFGQRTNAGTRNAPSQLLFFSLRNGVIPASGHEL